MKSIQQITINRRLRRETAWKLLAADNAPEILGLLAVHLLEKERNLPSSILHERVNRDLESIRAKGDSMPQTVQVYISQWLSAGFLERRYESKDSEEVYELTAAAVQAIRFIHGLDEKRTVATESRLSLVIQQIVQLAEQTETDPEAKIAVLEKERNRLDAEISAIREGHMKPLSNERAEERVREIILLADELANDFRQVKTGFQNLNSQLRESIMGSEGSRGDVLDEVFAGVDVIADTEEGRTFKAFWRLLTNQEQGMELEVALDQVLSRDFSQNLERNERRFLLQLTRILLGRGGEVHDVLQNFARGLKQFVQSQEYLQQRRINKLLKQAQRGALDIKEQLKSTSEINYTLNLSNARLSSVSQYQLRDPSLDELDAGILCAENAVISLESISELVAQSEIDFRSLKSSIESMLEKQDQVSIAEILQHYPAEQGLGSIVGYVSLGTRHGIVSEQKDTVSWLGKDGIQRNANIPRVYFLKEKYSKNG